MSGTGTPQLPNVLAITPGSDVPAPKIPALTPPNVQQGKPAIFSSVTDALGMMVQSKNAQLDASQKVIDANAKVDTAAQAQIEPLQQQVMEAMEKVQKAQRLPEKITGILSIFDSDYNVKYQAQQVDIANTKAKQIAERAAAIKTQNNALPEIYGKVADATKVVFDAQKDANDLYIKQQTLDDQLVKTKIEAAKLRIEQSQENRAATEFKIKGMTTEQIAAELPRAQAGKGVFAHLGGLLEERLVTQEKAATELQQAKLNLKTGNRVEYEASMVSAISHFPADYIVQQLNAAHKSGSPTIQMPVDVDPKTGKSIMGEVPVDFVEKALIQAKDLETKVNTALAADYSEKANLRPNITNLANVATAFAGTDPRFTQQLGKLNAVVKGFNPADPNSTRQTSLIIKDMVAEQKQWVDQQAKQYSTPTAQAAIQKYGATGQIDQAGGTAIVADVAGHPINTQSQYGTAWKLIQNQLATKLASQHVSAFVMPPGGNSADAMSVISAALAKQDGREKINELTQEILTDPNNVKPIRDAIKDNIATTGTNRVLQQLAAGKGANPIWAELYENTPVDGKTGKFSTSMFFEQLEKQRILSGNKVNYSKMFLDALQNYGVNANDDMGSNPKSTINDRAVEASIFGSPPHHAILSDLHYQYRVVAEKAHAEMMARIQKDVAGLTQRDAVYHADPMFGEWAANQSKAPATPDNPAFRTSSQEILKRTGVDLHKVPSATGLPMTAEQIISIFGGGK